MSQLTYLWTDVICKYLETNTLIPVSSADPDPLNIVQDAVFCYTVIEISLRQPRQIIINSNLMVYLRKQ